MTEQTEIKVFVGSIQSDNSGRQYDNTREVVFTGRELAAVDLPGYHNDRVSDTRGECQTLYQAADGRFFVHVKEWSRWQGEPTVYRLAKVTLDEIKADYWQLAAAADMGEALTLDEYLKNQEEEDGR